MGNIHVRLGNIFDNTSDLVLLPCSAKGTFTKAARQHIDKYHLPPPSPMGLGEIQLLPFTGSGTVTKYAAWCASILDDASSAQVIEQIARHAGEVTQAHPDVRLVETPLLGTGHGGLSVEESALALAKGFEGTSHRQATLVIYAWTNEIFLKVRAALEHQDSTLISAHQKPTTETYGSSSKAANLQAQHRRFVAAGNKATNRSKSTLWATWIFGSCSFVLLVGMLLFGPETLPPFKQQLLAWSSAMCSGLFGYFLTGSVGLDYKSTSSRFGQVVIKAGAGFALFLIVLWWWYGPLTPVKADHSAVNLNNLEQYAKGAPYPDISVELYYGPTQGMPRTLSVQPINPGFVSVFIENTNIVPAYDLIVSMIDCSSNFNHAAAMQSFNKPDYKWPARDPMLLHPNIVLNKLVPGNPDAESVCFDFDTKTRCADVSHHFRFVRLSNRWESAKKLTDNRTSALIGQKVSAAFPRDAKGDPLWR